MKRISTLFCFFLLAMLGLTKAQNPNNSGIVTGKVIDENQKLSLPGATIRIPAIKRYTVSNQVGRFELLEVPAGTYEIEVLYIGYATQKQTVNVQPGKTTSVDFSLVEGMELDEVVVLGDRLRGQARALNQQKNNQNITNIISSDQVGRFPDANIGDALKRVPGITMQNDQGEARNIIIRGLAPELNSVTLNGDRIPSAEGDNRRVQMDLIPSDMISTIEVNKTLTPDMDADAIGGSVNLITRASPNGQRISATLSGGYNPIREKPLYTGGLVYGNRFFDNKFGAVLSFSYNNNRYGSDNVEASWVEGRNGQVYVNSHDVRLYDVQRIRTSFSGAFDYKINDNHTLYASAMYNVRYDRENRYRYRTDQIAPVYDDNDNITGFTGRVGRQTKGGIDNGHNKMTRMEDQRVQNYSLRGEHLLSSLVDMDWSVSYSRASEDRPNERYILFRQGGRDVAFGGNTEFPYFTTLNYDDATMGLNEISENHDFTKEDEWGAKLNFRAPFSILEDQKGRLRFGLRLRLKNKNRDNIFYEYTSVIDAIGNLGSVPNTYFDGSNFQAGPMVPGLFASRDYLSQLDLTNPSLFEQEAVPSEYLGVNYRAKEQIYAGYLRWDQDLSSKLSMIAGARIERTDIDYVGNIVEDEEDLLGERRVKNSYVNVLPNISFRYNANESLVFRAAATTALARPNYYALTPFVSSAPGDMELTAGNPDLQSTYAWNFDLMVENYFKSVGIVSGGIFYKNLNDFIYTYANQQYTAADFAADFPDQANPIADGEVWQFSQSRNGDNVKVYGLEVAFQRQLDFLPGKFLKGFGIYTNYTYTKSKADGIYNSDGEKRDGLSLPGTAPHMFNASLSWENQRFSARLSGNYAAAYLDEVQDSGFSDVYYDKQFFLDANASYRITKSLRIFGEANNLTNQPLRYYQGIASRTYQAEYYRPRYNLGLKLDL